MRNGFYRDKEGNLAGAAISMPEALKNAQSQLRVSLQEAVEMCTSCVARAIKIDTEIGFIKIGYPAMFTVFDQNLEEVSTLIL
jgi:N-acetylglucosamine-6-phosphate deacetylase